jgi:hypothetical protein
MTGDFLHEHAEDDETDLKKTPKPLWPLLLAALVKYKAKPSS